MGMVAPQQRIASAYFVVFGKYGDVTHYAQERGVCRQWVYREAQQLQDELTAQRQELQQLRQQVRDVQEQNRELQERQALAVVIDKEMQAQLATVGQAIGVSLPVIWQLLEVLIPGQQQSVATLGRATKAAGEKAGPLLAVLDELARPRAREVVADEIYVNKPVLMVVEPESLCWLSGQMSDTVSGDAWAAEFRRLPNLEQVTRDGGKGLANGVAQVNAERQEKGQEPAFGQGDHFHALYGAGVGLRRAETQARKALEAAETAQDKLTEISTRQGQASQGASNHARAAWRRAEKAMDAWIALDQSWRHIKEALPLVTPEGELNTRQHAEAVLAETLPQLPDSDFAKTKRQLQKPEMLNYLDRLHQKIAALPFPEEVKQAAARQEGLRRRPELLKGEGAQAAALRGVMLMCAVVLAKAGDVGQQAADAVRDICRRAYRASSLVECINSVLRMQQSRHRKMTQGLLDLKRLYWNCHTFRTGRRRGTTPYQRLGIPWPEGLRCWELLKLTPEQLRDKLSTAKMPP
jgi:hypothetical protein